MKFFLPGLISSLCFLASCSDLPEPGGDSPPPAPPEKFDTLTDSDSHPGKSFSSPWSVTRTLLKGGKQEGVELLTLDNGKLKIVVIPTRGMGILEVLSGEIRLGWKSPVKGVVHPSYIDLESRGWPRAAGSRRSTDFN